MTLPPPRGAGRVIPSLARQGCRDDGDDQPGSHRQCLPGTPQRRGRREPRQHAAAGIRQREPARKASVGAMSVARSAQILAARDSLAHQNQRHVRVSRTHAVRRAGGLNDPYGLTEDRTAARGVKAMRDSATERSSSTCRRSARRACISRMPATREWPCRTFSSAPGCASSFRAPGGIEVGVDEPVDPRAGAERVGGDLVIGR